jgi:phage-related minor tail protein
MTHWTPDQRADAIGRALAVGADKASEATGIPRRTISSWLSRERPAPELDALILSSRDDVAAKLWEAVTVGTEAVLTGLRDPKARLGDKANALRIVAEQYALLTGGVTARTESATLHVTQRSDLNDAEVRDLRDWLDQLDEQQSQALDRYLRPGEMTVDDDA